MKVIETDSLILRTWKEEDRDAYLQINQDPKVIEFLLGSMSKAQVDNFMQNCNKEFEEKQFCLFAVELKESHELIGFIGLSTPQWEAHFTPAVEVGWRLGSQYWGMGYATEGAKAVLAYGFYTLGLAEIVSFTAMLNLRSIRVMKRIGMERDVRDDFTHPKLDLQHPLSKHVLYRIQKES